MVLYPPGYQGRTVGKVLCVLQHRMASLSPLCLVLCCALALGGCDYAGKAGASGQSTQIGQTGATAQAGVVISEVMSNNRGSLRAADGSTPDWIELYNAGSKAISLKGYMLSDNPRKPDKYVFEVGTIEAGAYLLLYAAGKEAVSAGNIYLPFKLSSDGEELTLIAPGVKVADRLTIPALPADISYGRNGSDATPAAAKVYFGEPTPGKVNGTDGKPTAEAAMVPKVATLLINEYCTSNASFYDEMGDTPDWVELYNSGAEPVDLSGYMLSDDLTKLDKWQFPKVSLAPKAYLLLLLSGKTTASTGETKPDSEGRLHVDFRLSVDDTQLVITDTRGRRVATAAIEGLPMNVSKGRLPDTPDTWAYFPRPTPGTANTTVSFPTLSQAASPASKDVLVSEVFAMDGANTAKPDEDWVELYNNTNKKIDLTGYGLSDNVDEPFRMKLAGVSIGPKSTVVITPQDFAISADGETILLTDPSGVVEDAFATGRLRAGASSGRQIGANTLGSLDRVFYVKPTKDRPNTTTAYKAYTEVPTITVKKEAGGVRVGGLYITQPVSVTIQTTQPDAIIHYTLDGKKPTSASAVYHGPIRVDRSLVVKAMAVRPGYLPSDPVSRTLLKETPHSLPVISLSGDPADLVGPTGALTSAAFTGEVPVELAFYEEDGRLGMDSQAGVELHGQFSRKESQRSLEVKFRSSYGQNEVTYPFFPDYDVATFRRLVLRTSGQDWGITKVRDAFMTRVIQGQLSLDTMAVRNCAVYINGQYWGLYEIREKLDQFYVASHYGVDPDQVDLIKGVKAAVAGSSADMQDLVKYCRTHDLRDPAAYKEVLARIDEESLMDWVIAESFFSNTDSGNKKFWRPRTPGGQYRWMVFDLDWAMFASTYKSDRLKGDLLDPAGHGYNDLFNTTLQVKLMANPDFREKFISRYAHFINTTFKTDRMLEVLDESVAIIRDEMPRQIARWGLPGTMSTWNRCVATLRRITSEKRALMIASLQKNFGLGQAKMKELFPRDFA